MSHEKACLRDFHRSDINWAVQPQKMVRGLKFRIKEEEQLYYLVCSEKKSLHS